MSKEITKKIVEDIYGNRFVSLKEDFSTILSQKATSLLENMKIEAAKAFFNKKMVNEGPDDPVGSVQTRGGNYPVYRRPSDPARSFRSAFADAVNRGDTTFPWKAADNVERTYSTGRQQRPAPAAAQQPSGGQSPNPAASQTPTPAPAASQPPIPMPSAHPDAADASQPVSRSSGSHGSSDRADREPITRSYVGVAAERGAADSFLQSRRNV